MARKVTLAFVFLGLWTAALAQQCPINSICFAIDESGSISGTQFIAENTAVKNVADSIESISISLGISTTYGAVGFSSSANVVSPLTNLATFKGNVDSNPKSGGGTSYGPALQQCRNLIGPQAGVRVIVLVTDGQPSDPAAATSEANIIKSLPNTFLVTIGVGLTSTATTLLRDLASGPEFFVGSTDFSTLTTQTGKILQAICPPPICPKSNFCRFRLTPQGIIVRKGKSFIVGVVGGSREASVRVGGSFVKISQWTPQGLAQRFSPSFFKTFSTVFPSMRSGVGYETPQRNQADFLDMSCVRLPFAAYQKLDSSGNVIDNVNTEDPRDCVDFQVEFPTAFDKATQTGR
uniref:VWFA domain-containing protein n=1 Tax=Compsopogon caeruleus TaxID=31354 RepID=A0A7S1XH88_9RHOD|mmetsp:Transcript_8190/g.16542  ORF Transcript_8190/g.16542 Transcript_8190/m.16542 type:complete len:349 (+) Transcript_8190:92-1138(+)|eukprot:CAMPEP_0184681282 /NCGR_PEP_ID=MMETSP0312-20130426/4242_1 /TAXON_ID=31354 /ORGANISM="Compsopogon coeruleus, Strain SAG 36.94" /LENGTH=348 /DNA_ID=CAMNT_0027132013 /DNA_START=69 /DNA_END=1115 /DNA_ORIENTATION=+